MIRDFTDYIQNEELLRLPLPGTTIYPIKPDSNSSQDPVYYLDKRLFMDNDINNPDIFFIYTMKKKEWRHSNGKWNVSGMFSRWLMILLGLYTKDPGWMISMIVSRSIVNSSLETVPKSLMDVSPRDTFTSEAWCLPYHPSYSERKKETFMNCVNKFLKIVLMVCFLDFVHQHGDMIPDFVHQHGDMIPWCFTWIKLW